MEVGNQFIHASTFNRHLVARAHAKKKTRKTLLLSLSLTSMVDMFSLLVIFLLQTFSTSPEMLVSNKDLVLPIAASGRELVDAPNLSVTQTGVYLDQKLVGETEQVLKEPELFLGKLKDLRELWQKSHPDQKFKGEMNFQAHKTVPSTVISQLMGMLPSQNYDSIQLIVTSGGVE